MLVEGGAQLAAALLRADLVDALPVPRPGNSWRRRCPRCRHSVFSNWLPLPRFVRRCEKPLGDDMLTELARTD